MQAYDVRPALPREQSLIWTIKSNGQLGMLPEYDQDNIILLAEFASCSFYAYGVDAWASDLLGTRLQFGLSESGHMPVPFDIRGFEGHESVLDTNFGSRTPSQILDFVEHMSGPKLVAAVPYAAAFAWMEPSATPEQRHAILVATVKDSFRVGPHFVTAYLFEIERNIVQLRFKARELGLVVRFCPEAWNSSLELRAEISRMGLLMAELINALPDEIFAVRGRREYRSYV